MAVIHNRGLASAEAPEVDQRYSAMLGRLNRSSEILTRLLRSKRLARDEYPPMVRLAEGFRWVLDQHSPSPRGRCLGCPRTWLGARPRWPCSIARAVHSALVE